jgi:galactonate dehydratase
MQISQVHAHLHSGEYSDLIFVEIKTSDPAVSGWGECTLPGKPYAVAGAVRDAARLIMGMPVNSIRRIWATAYRHSYWRGGAVETSALSGIDIALWDIMGKILHKPVYELLGGAVRDSIKAYANCGLSTDPEELARRAKKAIDAGFQIVKFYPLPPILALPPTSLISNVYDCCAAVREVIGPSRDFAIDLHGRTLPHTVIAIEHALRDLRPLWIEEPVPSEDIEALARIRGHFQTPIALGERLFTRWQFKQVLDRGLVDIIQPDVGNVGGLSEMRVLAEMAEAYHVAFGPHSPNGLLHTCASLHCAAIAQTFAALEFRPSDITNEIFDGLFPLMGKDGTFKLPSSSGVGLSVKQDKLLFEDARVPRLSEQGIDGTPLDW